MPEIFKILDNYKRQTELKEIILDQILNIHILFPFLDYLTIPSACLLWKGKIFLLSVLFCRVHLFEMIYFTNYRLSKLKLYTL